MSNKNIVTDLIGVEVIIGSESGLGSGPRTSHANKFAKIRSIYLDKDKVPVYSLEIEGSGELTELYSCYFVINHPLYRIPVQKKPQKKRYKVLEIFSPNNPDLKMRTNADIVYKNNQDGTYYIQKNRFGNQDCDVSTEDFIDLLKYALNN